VTTTPTIDFQKALTETLKYEGGYINHPADPGGETNKGVTKVVYDAYRAKNKLPARSVKLISDEELQAIYFFGYWVPAQCGVMPWPLSACAFDYAVNSGVKQAITSLQRVLGVTADGDFGPVSQKALANYTSGDSDLDPDSHPGGVKGLVREYLDARRTFFRGLAKVKPKLQVFLAGWLKRVDQLQKFCLGA